MGGFDPLIPVLTDDGCGVLTRPYPSVTQKIRFLSYSDGPRRDKVDSSPHNTDHTSLHGHVEETDTKGSTWISKDT